MVVQLQCGPQALQAEGLDQQDAAEAETGALRRLDEQQSHGRGPPQRSACGAVRGLAPAGGCVPRGMNWLERPGTTRTIGQTTWDSGRTLARPRRGEWTHPGGRN